MKKEVTAETFTPFYDPLEDRIKLVINYQNIDKRVDLMITRSFIINFIPASDEYLFKYYPSESTSITTHTRSQGIKTEKDKEDTTKTAKSNLSKTDNTNMQLLQKEAELLLKIDFMYHKDSKKTTLVFTTQKSVVKAVLTATMLQQLIQTIKTAIPNFSWGIAQNF